MVTSRYIDPTTDFGFKRLFGQEDSKDILKSFLQAVLNLPRPIAELTYMPGEQLPDSASERSGIYDIYCIDSVGQRFVVEMQRLRQSFFKDRSLYYATFPITQQIRRGETDFPFRLLPIYVIAILNFAMDSDPRYLRRVELRDSETHQLFYDKLFLVYIELPKFRRSLDEHLSPGDEWIYLLRNLPELESIPAALDKEPFTRAFQISEEAALSPAERQRYEASLQRTLDERGVYLTGRRDARLEIARALRARGLDSAEISQITGLSAEELDTL
jgi:predicted transposase/invertase (TIGR01784 family)